MSYFLEKGYRYPFFQGNDVKAVKIKIGAFPVYCGQYQRMLFIIYADSLAREDHFLELGGGAVDIFIDLAHILTIKCHGKLSSSIALFRIKPYARSFEPKRKRCADHGSLDMRAAV